MADLREQLETLAASVEPQSPDEVMRRARVEVDSRTRDQGSGVRRARIVVALVAAVAVLATAAAVVLVRSTTRDSGQPAGPTTGTTLPSLFVPEGEEDGTLFLVPRSVPEGFTAFRVAGGRAPGKRTGGGGSTEIDRRQTWVRLDKKNDRAVQRFSVSWGPGAPGVIHPATGRPISDDPLQAYRDDGKPVNVRGTQGFYSHGNLAWEEPEGRLVQIYSEDRNRRHLSPEQLLAIADGLRPRDDGGFEPTRVPPGFRFAGETPGVASDGTNRREVVYQSADGRGFMLIVLDDSDTSPAGNLFDPRAHVVKVRGFDAVATPMIYNGVGSFDSQTMGFFGANQYVQWREPGDVIVQLSGVGLEESELLRIARGLRAVGAQGWDEFTAQAPGRNGATPIPEHQKEFTGEDAEIEAAFKSAFDGATVEEVAPHLEDGDQLGDAIAATLGTYGDPTVFSAEVHTIERVNRQTALVSFSVLLNGRPNLSNQQGAAVKIDGHWLVRRATYCAIIEIGRARCPAPTATTTGPPPTNEVAARRAVTETFVKANDSDTPLRQRIALVDNPRGLKAAYEAARRSFPEALADYTVEVRDVRFTNENEAVVVYDLLAPAAPVTEFPNRIGGVVRIEGEWKVTRATVCAILGLAQAGGCTTR